MIEEIILVKLVNDEQYIGVLKEEDAEGIRLQNPLRVHVSYSPKNVSRPNVIVLPWNELSKMNDVYLDKFHVLYYTMPKEDIVKFYKKQVKETYTEETEETEIAEDLDVDTLKAYIEKMTSNTIIH